MLFVDIDPDGGDPRALRDAPHTFLASARLIVVRCTGTNALEDVDRVTKRLALRSILGLLVQDVGKPARIEWVGGATEPTDGIAARAREVEVRGLLKWRGAVWEPTTHHYLLPSGQHASGFVKIGQAIAEPRDADVLASWLLDRFDSHQATALVIDSGTLTPIALSLRSTLRESLGRIAILDRYPSTDVAVERAIEAAAVTNRIVGVISVCASGRLRDRMRNVFSWRGHEMAWSLDSIVDLGSTSNPDGPDRSWVHLTDGAGGAIQSYSTDCQLCRTFDRSVVVPVDPKAFDAYLPTMRERHMPDVIDADRNRELWNACSRSGCIQLEARPDDHVVPFRPDREILPVKFDVAALLEDEGFRVEATRRIKRLLDEVPALKDADLVLSLDSDPPGTKRTAEVLWSAFGRELPQRTFSRGEWAEPLNAAIRDASRILVVSPGTVTGDTLQRALVGVQDARRSTRDNYDLHAITIHARPGHSRDWQTLKNSYADQAYAAFVSHLPRFSTPMSPIQDEGNLLETRINPEPLSERGRAFWSARREYCGGRGGRDVPLFWGQAPGLRLSAHSIFGDGLDAVTTYAAVSSAMHARRLDGVKRPNQLAFELPAMFRSYYDPLIVASILRWLRPTEAWWGDTPDNAEIVILEILARAQGVPETETMLLAELLLAAALGKVPEHIAKKIVREKARRRLEFDESGVLEVAVALPIGS